MSDMIPREPTRDDYRTANPYGELSQQTRPVGAIANAEQQKSIAEVQARMIIARANPRDPIRCMDLILRDCTRPSLADSGLYQYSRGGSSISGPSIRLAEAIAQRWGNIASGIKEVSRAGGYSECVAYAWDLESGYYDERQFQVRHWRDTKGGGYALTDERDIYELIANMGQRRKRAVLLTVIPGDVVEAATEQCESTLKTTADTSPDALARIATAFEQYGITKAQIEKRCQCRLEAIRPAQVVQLRKIFASIKDGMSDAKDWFEAPNGAWAGVEAGHEATKPTQQPTRTRRTKAEMEAARAAEGGQTGQQEDGIPTERWEEESRATNQTPPANPATANPAAPASEREGSHDNPPAGAVAFSEYLVDGEGTELADGDGVIEPFTDPVAFANAYADARATMFPGDIELFDRANHDALAKAQQTPGVAAIIVAARGAGKPVAASDNPGLPMDLPVDDAAVLAPPAKPTKADYDKYKAALTSVLATAATPDAINHAIDVNAGVYDKFPPSHRLACKAIIEDRQKALSPAPARNAEPDASMSANDLIRDIDAQTSVADLDAWEAMAGGHLQSLLAMSIGLHGKVIERLKAKHAELEEAEKPEPGFFGGIQEETRDPRAIADAMKLKLADIKTKAAFAKLQADDKADIEFLIAGSPEIWTEVKAVAMDVFKDLTT